MRYFIDSEFLEDGRAIDPISLAVVAEDGRELYLEFAFDRDRAQSHDFVREHVLPRLRLSERVDRAEAAARLLAFVGDDSEPQFWAYFGSYDWVLICQLFGTMQDLPPHFPMFVRDLKQNLADVPPGMLAIPPTPEVHDALADARWLRDAFAVVLGFLLDQDHAFADLEETLRGAAKKAAGRRGGASAERPLVGRRFPVLNAPPGSPTSIPWDIVEPHERQAQINHGGQSLERLAQRGGLSPVELYAVVHDLQWRWDAPVIADDSALEWLADLEPRFDKELRHGTSLLAEIVGWTGQQCRLKIDPACAFDPGGGPCGAPLANAIVLEMPETERVAVLALCEHHTSIMETAVRQWRDRA